MKIKVKAFESTSSKGTHIYAGEYSGLKKIPEWLSPDPVLLSKEKFEVGDVTVVDRPLGVNLDEDGRIVLSWFA